MRVRRGFIVPTVVVAGSLLAAPAPATSLQDSVYMGGYVSQGYVNSSNHNYLVPNTRDGSGEFNEAAFNLSAQPLDDLRLGIQFLGRDFGSRIDAKVTVDWAYGDWRWRDELGVRAGKIKLPYGLYNQGRDVDFLRTPVLLPQSVYTEAERDLVISYEGVGLYGNLPWGAWGEFDYELCYGSLSVPEEGVQSTQEEIARNLEAGTPALAASLADQFGVTPEQVDVGIAETDVEMQVPWIVGGAVVWTTPIAGLRVGTSVFAGDIEIAGRVDYDVFVDEGEGWPTYLPLRSEFDDDLDLHSVVTTSAEYTRGPWLFAAEMSRTRMGGVHSLGWYASGRHRLDRRWSFAATYSQYFPDWDDREGEALAARTGDATHRAWQYDLGFSARFDVNDYWLLKLEYHQMDGTALALAGGPDASTSDARHWHVIMAKTTFHF